VFIPETPSFLLATGDTEGFTASIQKITGETSDNKEALSQSCLEGAQRKQTTLS
jgi:hypothetical protein